MPLFVYTSTLSSVLGTWVYYDEYPVHQRIQEFYKNMQKTTLKYDTNYASE